MPSVTILLAQLYSRLQPPNSEPLAIQALGAAVSEQVAGASVDLTLVDNRRAQYQEHVFLNRLRVRRPQVVGLSIPQGTGSLGRTLIKQVREELGSAVVVVVGHALPTQQPETWLTSGADVAVLGWGEHAFALLCDAVLHDSSDWSSISGIAFRESGGEIVNTGVGDWRPSNMPPPRLFNYGDFFARVEASRGCNYGYCTFCVRPPGPLRQWMPFSIERVLADVANIVDSGHRSFTFADEDFFGDDTSRVFELVEGLAAHRDLDFTISLRVDGLSARHSSRTGGQSGMDALAALRGVGLRRVFLGVESLSATQLARYGKGLRPRNSVEVVQAVAALGIEVEVGFIPFDPKVRLDELIDNYGMSLESGMYQFLGTPFGWMRPHRDARVSRGLTRQLGTDPETLELHWKFESDDVSSIFTQIRSLWNPVDHLYLLARNAARTSLLDETDTSAVLRELAQVRYRSCQAALDLLVATREGVVRPDLDTRALDLFSEFSTIRDILGASRYLNSASCQEYVREYELVEQTYWMGY